MNHICSYRECEQTTTFPLYNNYYCMCKITPLSFVYTHQPLCIIETLPISSLSDCTYNKWKNHFYEMKGDVGMSLHEKERNKKMPTPRHKVTHNPIPTSLTCCFYECIRQSKQHNILTSNCLHENVRCSLGKNKDVGMGL